MIRLAVRVRSEHAEVVLAELLELAPSGVEEVDLPGDRVEYAVYGASGELPSLPDLRAAAGDALVEIHTSEVADDWAQRWRQFHRPVVLGDRLAVRPPWEPPSPAAVDLVIDPGQAFGTGAHATTRLCLELMLSLPAQGSFLDLGCGSGVLAIAAARLGWHPVLALDNDPLSVKATAANARANDAVVQAARLDLRSDDVPEAETVAANLLGPLLLSLAERLSRGDRLPERLLVSGLLGSEADRIAVAFARCGLTQSQRRERGEWAALLLER
ncbi:MAG: 50S ribosomal protein L11 methyltransferase [Actinomycetota bacterium]|nr:50S ribosomal protein L11 methyltransferase [Actinomycetota bacterium]